MTKTTIEKLSSGSQLTREAGDWITGRMPQPETEIGAAALRSMSADSRPGNLRFAIDGRQAYLLGDLRDPEGVMTLSEAHERLFAPANDPAAQVSQMEFGCMLGETGYEWSLSQDDPGEWQAVANDSRGFRCDLTATILRNGVEVRSLPAAWNAGSSDASEGALLRFFAAAHNRIRFARFALQDGKSSAVSFAAADRVDVELPDSVAAVVAACRLVWREVPALSDAAVAQAYLETLA